MTRSKKGLSTLVGAVFIVLALAVGLNAFIYALNQQDRYAQVATQRTQTDWDRLNEDLAVTKVDTALGKFNVTLMNKGKLPIKLDSMWVTNQTDKWHQKFDFIPAKEIGPSKTIKNIGQDLALTVLDSKSYKLKFITERGNAVGVRSVSVAEADLKLSIFLMPRTITTGENITILLSVKNNQLDADSIRKINPIMDYSVCIPIPTCIGVIVTPKSTPTQLDSLARDSTALFKWIYKVEAPVNTIIRFNASIQNGKPGNFVTDDLSVMPIKADISSFASAYGTITIDYASLRWSDTGGLTPSDWKSGWAVLGGKETIWKINMTNQDSRPIYISKNSVFVLQKVSSAANNPWYIVAAPSTITTALPYVDYSLVLLPKVKTIVYFAATAEGGGNIAQTPASTQSKNQYAGFMLMFGTYDAPGSADTYGQNIPFLGIIAVTP